jgi:hypothetical protein
VSATDTVTGEKLLDLMHCLEDGAVDCFAFDPLVAEDGSYFSFDAELLPQFTQWSAILRAERLLADLLKVLSKSWDIDESRGALEALWAHPTPAWVLMKDGKAIKDTTDTSALYCFLAPDIAHAFLRDDPVGREGEGYTVEQFGKLSTLAEAARHYKTGLRFVYSQDTKGNFKQFQLNKW